LAATNRDSWKGLLVLTAIVFNKLVRRNYPHQAPTPPVTPVVFDAVITRADIDTVLKKNQELLDISEEDIESIIIQAELIAKSRKSN
jgi:CBS domain-containing membrane protein